MNEKTDLRGIVPSNEEIVEVLELYGHKNIAGTLTRDEAKFGLMLTRVMEIVFKLRAQREKALDERDQARGELATEQMGRAADKARAMVDTATAQEATRRMIVIANKRGEKNDTLLALVRGVQAAGAGPLPKLLRKRIAKVIDEQT